MKAGSWLWALRVLVLTCATGACSGEESSLREGTTVAGNGSSDAAGGSGSLDATGGSERTTCGGSGTTADRVKTTSAISQNGVTWQFVQEVEYGTFANGDYWV